MKLCPQCDFIYEDEQGFCDMDGRELVHNRTSRIVDQSAPPKFTANPAAQSRRKRVPALLAGAAVLAALLSVIYLGQRQQSLTSDAAAIPIQSLQQANANEANPQTSPANSISNSVTEPSQPAESPDASSPSVGTVNALADAYITRAPSVRAAEAFAPASADTSAADQSRLVLVRLTNGATIKADDAGQTRNGVWYRQGGMFTFLKRNQVRAIERRRSSSSPARAQAGQNQLRLRRLEPATVKRESRVTSFLKKTGQILSKPFKR